MGTLTTAEKWWIAGGCTIAGLVIIYTFGGFFGVPALMRWGLTKYADPIVARKITASDIYFNPYTLYLNVQGLNIQKEGDNIPLVHVNDINTKVSWESLFKLAPILDHLTIDGFQAHIVRTGLSQFNFSDIIDNVIKMQAKDAEEEKKEDEKPSEPMKFAVAKTEILNSGVILVDKYRGRTNTITKFDFTLPMVSNFMNEIDIPITPQLSFNFDGHPFNSNANSLPFTISMKTGVSFGFKDLSLENLASFNPIQLNALVTGGTLSGDFNLNFANDDQKTSQVKELRLKGNVQMKNVVIEDILPRTPYDILKVKAIDVDLKKLAVFAQEIELGEVKITDPDLVVVRNTPDSINLTELATHLIRDNPLASDEKGEEALKKENEEQAKEWLWSLEKLTLENGSVHFQDKTNGFAQNVTPLNITVDSVSSTPENESTLAFSTALIDGRIAINGQFCINPVKANLHLQTADLNVGEVQPYLSEFLNGTLNAIVENDGTATFALENGTPVFNYAGDLNINNFSVQNERGVEVASLSALNVTDVDVGGQDTAISIKGNVALEDFVLSDPRVRPPAQPVKFKEFTVGIKDISLAEHKAEIGEVKLVGPEANVVMSGDNINLVQLGEYLAKSLVKEPEKKVAEETPTEAPVQTAEAETEAPAKPWNWSLQKAMVENGNVHFEDQSNGFSQNITPLNAAVASLSSEPKQIGQVEFSTGVIGGTVSVNGAVGINPVMGELQVQTQNLDISQGMPYLQAFLNGALAGFVSNNGKVTFAVNEGQAGYNYAGSARLDGFNLTTPQGADIASFNSLALNNVDVAGKNDKIALKGNAELNDFLLSDPRGGVENHPVRLKGLNVSVQEVNTNSQNASIGEVKLVEPEANVIMANNGEINLVELGQYLAKSLVKEPERTEAEATEPKSVEVAAETTEEAPAKPWNWELKKAVVENGNVHFADRANNFEQDITPLNASLESLSSVPKQTSQVQFSTGIVGGTVDVNGIVGINPVMGDMQVKTENLDISQGMPYLEAFLNGALAGFVSNDGKVTFAVNDGQADYNYAGNLKVDGFNLTTLKGAEVASFDNLALKDIDVAGKNEKVALKGTAELNEFILSDPRAAAGNHPVRVRGLNVAVNEVNTEKQTASIGNVKVVGPSANVVMAANGAINLAQLGDYLATSLVKQAAAAEPAKENKAEATENKEDPKVETAKEKKEEAVKEKEHKAETAKERKEEAKKEAHKTETAKERKEEAKKEEHKAAAAKENKAEATAQKQDPKPVPANAPWKWSVAKVQVSEGNVQFTDAANNFTKTISSIAATAGPISQNFGNPIEVGLNAGVLGGNVSANGSVVISPLRANITAKTSGLQIAELTPFISPFLNARITDGQVSNNGTVIFSMNGNTPNVQYDGSVGLNRLNVTDAQGVPVASLGSLSATGINLKFANELSVGIQNLSLANPTVDVVKSASGVMNVTTLVKESGGAKSEAAAPASTGAHASSGLPAISLGQIAMTNGTVRFKDNELNPPFSVNATELKATVTGFSTTSNQAANVSISGLLNGTPMEANGSINPFASNLTLNMKGQITALSLPAFSAFSSEFTGYPITEGHLTYKGSVEIKNQKLNSTNNIVINKLEFGNENPNAKDKLPVKLAVSLLQNRNGEITLNLPVDGSLNDPDFSVGGIIVKVLTNLITKAVTAPFTLLGNIGSGITDLFTGGNQDVSVNNVYFATGSAQLSPEAQQALGVIAQAMNQRPGMNIQVTGYINTVGDAPGLANQRAQAVRNYLVNQLNVNANRVFIVSNPGGTQKPPVSGIGAGITLQQN